MTEYSSFVAFMASCDRVLLGTVGVTHSDLCDAPWHDYYTDELTAQEACASALVEWNDMDYDTLYDIGLGGYI